MNRGIIITAVCLLLAVPPAWPIFSPGVVYNGSATVSQDEPLLTYEPPRDLGRLLDGVSGSFVENRGQVANAEVRYYAQGDRLTVGLTPTGAMFTLREERRVGSTDLDMMERTECTSTSFRLDLVGCQATEPRGVGAPGYASNFFIGNDPDRWVRGATSFTEVVYQEIYPGIDLRFHFKDGMLKYEFILSQGADSDRILLRYDGVDGLAVDTVTGDLVIALPIGELRDARPVIMQEGVLPQAGAAGGFELLGEGMVGFDLPTACDLGRPLVIDPGLEFSTLFGGRSKETTDDVGMDDDGNVYLLGTTMSDDLRVTPGAFNDTLNGLADMFVAKFDPKLSTLMFATYIGGFSQNDEGMMIRVVHGDGIYICGYTESNDFPTTPGVVAPTALGGRDAFLLELSLDGGTLLKSTFLGGSNLDAAKTLDIDGNGDIYVSGRTLSSNLPTTPGAYDRIYGGNGRGDGYVIKVNDAMDRVVFCTYIGGGGEEFSVSMRLGMDSNMYLIGQTESKYFPVTPGAFCMTYNGGAYDVFISKLSADGGRLLNSTFIGGNNTELPMDIQFMDNGSVVVLLAVLSPNFPMTANAICSTWGGEYDIVLSMMDANLKELQFSSFLGGNGVDSGYELAWGPGKQVLYISGYTTSTDLSCTEGAYDPLFRGSADLTILGIEVQSLSLSYLTYLGGESSDYQQYGGISVDADGHLAIAGYSYSLDFPTTSKANRTFNNGSSDAFVLWFDPVPCGAPDAPTGLGAVAGNGHIDLSWTVPFNESYRLVGQRLYRGTSPDDVSERVELGLGGEYNDTDVTNGVTYYYQVVTVSSAGESVRTPVVSARPLGPPSAPVGLVAATGDGAVNLTWERPTQLGGDLAGYHILRGTSSGDLHYLTTIGPTEGFLDTDVALGTTYYYAVMAFNDLFNGTTSLVVRIKALGPPSAPQDLRAVAGNQSVRLDWSVPLEDGGSTILAYYVYTSLSGVTWDFHTAVLPTTLNYEDRGLENGRTYQYTVKAVSIVGESPSSEAVNATPIGPPGIPRAVVAAGIPDSIRLTWDAPLLDGGAPITGYRIYCGARVDTLALLHITDANTMAFAHSPVPNGGTRYYAISAYNAEGEGELSPIVQATAMGLPSAPRDLTAMLSNGTIRLSWGAPDDDGGSPRLIYRVMRGTSDDALTPLTEITGILEHIDTDVQKGNTYFYRVVAVNVRGDAGVPSMVVRQDMIGPPGVPVNLIARAGDRAASITWGPPPFDPDAPVDVYAVLRGTTATDLEEIARVRVTLYDDRDPALDNGVTYFYAIVAINEIGEGPRTATVPATPRPPPGTPSLKARVSDGNILLEWVPPTGEAAAITGYILYRGTDITNLQVVAELGVVTKYTDSYLRTGQTYHYRVRATSLSGDGMQSESVSVELPEEVGEASGLMPVLVGLIIVVALLAGVLMLHGRGGAGTKKG